MAVPVLEVFLRIHWPGGGGGRGRGSKFFRFHAVFWENLAKSYASAPRIVGAPPPGIPGSATGIVDLLGRTHEHSFQIFV